MVNNPQTKAAAVCVISRSYVSLIMCTGGDIGPFARPAFQRRLKFPDRRIAGTADRVEGRTLPAKAARAPRPCFGSLFEGLDTGQIARPSAGRATQTKKGGQRRPRLQERFLCIGAADAAPW